MRKLIWFTAILFCLIPLTVWAQDTTPVPTTGESLIPLVHVVQEGENLTIIANTYQVTVEELLAINHLTNADTLAVGQQLIIPGSTGDAVATVYTVQAGDTLAHIAAIFNTTADELMATNGRINRQQQPVIGDTLTIVSRTGSALAQPITGTSHVVKPGESLLTIAAKHGRTPAEIATANNLTYPYILFRSQRLRIPDNSPDAAVYRDLPGEWVEVGLRPLPIQQGSTVSIFVKNLLDGTPQGSLAGQPLRFFPYENGFVALVGIDAFTEPGMYTLELAGSGSQPWQPFSQNVPIASSGFGLQQIVVEEDQSALLDPLIRQEEDAFLSEIYYQSSDIQAWEGLFQFPVTTTIVTGGYGDGRSYNGGPVEGYHTGLDFAGGIGTPTLAPANGTVVFADLLKLRGNVVIIDHGLGVMTAYFHLSDMFVSVGEPVTPGQPIGAGGSTGLSTGPHLHWDVRVNNVPVNGLQWTEQLFP